MGFWVFCGFFFFWLFVRLSSLLQNAIEFLPSEVIVIILEWFPVIKCSWNLERSVRALPDAGVQGLPQHPAQMRGPQTWPCPLEPKSRSPSQSGPCLNLSYLISKHNQPLYKQLLVWNMHCLHLSLGSMHAGMHLTGPSSLTASAPTSDQQGRGWLLRTLKVIQRKNPQKK